MRVRPCLLIYSAKSTHRDDIAPLPDSRAPYAYGNVFKNYGGVPFATACAKHAEDTFHLTRIFILLSATLANSTSTLADLKAALGGKVRPRRSVASATLSSNPLLRE
ncbi:hypothetical protein C8R45DRAFT_1110862 [Mycena sanguinolenta]|nr:hypothetical protein C8R45DRAFT_1110862 [Mycena sanguinolenta]